MQKIKTSLVAAAIVFCLAQTAQAQRQKVCFKKHCFSAELATTPEEHSQGLMFRKQLGADEGMLFIFPREEIHPFWMKNTYIPLDIIWLDKDKKVVFIKEGAQSCQEENCPVIYPDRKAAYVLEVISGTVGNIGLSVGDSLSF